MNHGLHPQDVQHLQFAQHGAQPGQGAMPPQMPPQGLPPQGMPPQGAQMMPQGMPFGGGLPPQIAGAAPQGPVDPRMAIIQAMHQNPAR